MEIAGIRFGRRRGEARCAYCHDRLDGACVACEACGTTLHDECRNQHGRCPTLGCSGRARPHLVARTSPALGYGPVLDDAGLACLSRLAALRPVLEVEWNARGRPAVGARRRLRGELEVKRLGRRLGTAVALLVVFELAIMVPLDLLQHSKWATAPALWAIEATLLAVAFALVRRMFRPTAWSKAASVLEAGQFSVGLLSVERHLDGDTETVASVLWLPEGAVELGNGEGTIVDFPPRSVLEPGEYPVAVWHDTAARAESGSGSDAMIYVQPANGRGFLVTGTRPRPSSPTLHPREPYTVEPGSRGASEAIAAPPAETGPGEEGEGTDRPRDRDRSRPLA